MSHEEIRRIVDERYRELRIQDALDTGTDPIEEAVEEAVADLASRGRDDAIEKLRDGDVSAAKEALNQIAEKEEAASAT
ncbi:MAG: hypothetical protein IIB71_07500, partial [Proteobacteria bacterium]|nr:hypothetical protein [Pseudomonadota bacterium]